MEKAKRIPVNNGRYKRVEQAEDAIIIHTENKNGERLENPMIISGADFVTMVNWYRYQKDSGNNELMF